MRGANVDISPNGLREAWEYSSVLSNLFPIMVVGGVAAGAAAAAGDEAAPAAEESAVPDDFGFGASGANNDGFGF